MKKIILSFALIVLGVQFSQAQLTNAQVYDFEVGDVFQVTFDGNYGGPAPIETDTVITKYYSANMDTLFYVMDHLQYTASFFQTPPIYNYSTDTLVVTNLSAPANHFFYTSCLPETDSMIINNCGNTVERRHSNFDSTCFEPSNWYSDVIIGLGGPYYYRYDPTIISAGSWIEKKLTYYKTSQLGECGTFQAFAGVGELAESFELTVSPNPVIKELQITSKIENATYSIYSYNGQMIVSHIQLNQNKKIDVSELLDGYYFLEINDNQRSKTIAFIKR